MLRHPFRTKLKFLTAFETALCAGSRETGAGRPAGAAKDTGRGPSRTCQRYICLKDTGRGPAPNSQGYICLKDTGRRPAPNSQGYTSGIYLPERYGVRARARQSDIYPVFVWKIWGKGPRPPVRDIFCICLKDMGQGPRVTDCFFTFLFQSIVISPYFFR